MKSTRSLCHVSKSFALLSLAFLSTLPLAGRAAADTQMAIIGDAGKTTPSSAQVRNSIVKMGVSQLILPGDNLYSGTYQSVWSPWTAARLSFDVVAIGNHHGGYKQEMAYFGMPGEYFAKVIDGARFLVLNSDNVSTATPQAKWLEAELNSAKEPLIFLVYHHPSYTISSFHKWEEKAAFHQAIRPLIWKYRSKINALLVGHDHLATVLHFNDLPVIVSGAIHEQRDDQGVNYVDHGIAIKTAWFFDRNPYWARLAYRSNTNEAQFDFVRATDNKVTCSFRVRTGSPAVPATNCAGLRRRHP